jgi:hypothetical protein
VIGSYRADGEAELEAMLRRVDQSLARAMRGQAGRYPARRLMSILRQQGFLPTQHFLDRLRERAQARGIRFDPRLFGGEFQRARHYRQTRPGYTTRIAVMRGLPILYRMGGQAGNRIVLVGLLPQGRLPPVVPAPAPRLRESEALFGRLWSRLATSGSRRRIMASAPRNPRLRVISGGASGGRAGGTTLSGSGGAPRLSGNDTLVVGRGTVSRRSSVPDVGAPLTMDGSSATRPHYHTPLDQALNRYPELRGVFRDVFLERMGINPSPQPGVSTIGVTPAGMRMARDMLRQGGTLRVLQRPNIGQSLQDVEFAIRSMLSPHDFTNIQVAIHHEDGADHVLLTATRL